MKYGTLLLKVAYAAVALVMIGVLYKQRDTLSTVISMVDPVMVAAASVVLILPCGQC